ncbi:X-linked retinitis pigmentosa GTPase regulator-interacting protein 1 [Anabrus simplex]|uniref:X-linked retinitis pigmentosa GTPase regulator-interacting protein 1 n=1 Tax=Anabrus simplex TaxID=316456 RepID=UPI0035A386EC
MADDPERDLIPVKEELNYDSRMKAPVSPYPLDERGHSTLQNHAISKLERYDLEDRFLQIQEENIRLKKQCHQQEDKYKRLAAKLLRLASDRKQRLPTAEQRRDLNTEDVITEQEVRIRELEQLNSNLQDRLVVLKQQLASHSRVHNAAHCGPRSVSRSPSRQRGSGLLSNSDLYRVVPSGESGTLPCDDNAELRAAQEQEKRLMAEITVLRQQMQEMEQEIRLLREQAARHGAEQEEELVNDAMEEKRQKVAENVEMIRMKRLCKQQATQLLAQKAHKQAVEHELAQLKQSFELIQKENDDLHEQVLQERKKVAEYQQEVSSLLSYKETVKELREEILDNQREKATLKQHNQQLLALSATALNTEQTHEKQMMEKLGHLEVLLTAERAEKGLAKQQLEDQQLLVNSLQKQLLQQENQCLFLENSLKTLTMTSQSAPVVPRVVTQIFDQPVSPDATDFSSKEGSSFYFSSTAITKQSSSTLPEGFVLYSAGADSASESYNDFNQQISKSVRNKIMSKTLEDTNYKHEYNPAHEDGSPSTISSGSGETSDSPSSLTSNSRASSLRQLKEHKEKNSLPEVNRPSRSCPSSGSGGMKLEHKQEVGSPIHEPRLISSGTSKKTDELNKAMVVRTSKENNIQVGSHIPIIKSSSGQSKSILKTETREKNIRQESVEFSSEFSRSFSSEGKSKDISLLDAARRPANHHGSKTKQIQMDSLIHKSVELLNDTVENTNELVRTVSTQTSEKEAAYYLKMATRSASSSSAHASRDKQLQTDIPIPKPVELCRTSKYTSELDRSVVARAHDDDKTQEALHLETARELEKCRELLRVQYNLNSLYKKEVENLNSKLREKEEELEKQLKEQKTDLKFHSSTIDNLENKCDNDLGESGRVPRVSAAADKDGIHQDISMTSDITKTQSVVLDLSEALFQIYLQNVEFDLDEKKLVNKKFQLQWTFYNHDTSFSPWFSGKKSNLDHSTLYKVDINSNFMEYLFREQCTVNLYMESPGTTGIIAMGKLYFSGALDNPYEKWKLSIPLQVLCNQEENIGVLYCWYQMVCSHKAVKSFVERYCSLKRKVCSSKFAAEACSEVLNKKSGLSLSKKISEDISYKDSSSKHLIRDESSCATEGQEAGNIRPEICSSSDGQCNQQCQSPPLQEFKPITSKEAEKTSLSQHEENVGKSVEQSSSVVKTDAVLPGSDIKPATCSCERVPSDRLATQLHTSSTPVPQKPSDQIGSFVTFRKSLRSERPSGIASPISQKAIQSSLRKLVISTDTKEQSQTTLSAEENIVPSDLSRTSDLLKPKLTEKSTMILGLMTGTGTTENNYNSVYANEFEGKESEGSVRSISFNYGKQFSSAVITPIRSDTNSSKEEVEDTPSDSIAKGMPDPTSDSEGDISSVFEESNWRNYSLRSLQTQNEIGKENNHLVPEAHQDYSLTWASDESSSVSIAEDLKTSDKSYEDKVIVKGDVVQLSSSSTTDVEKVLDAQQEFSTEPSANLAQATDESCELPLKWEESLQIYISHDSSKHIAIQSDGAEEIVQSCDEEDSKDVEVQIRNKSSENVSTVSEPNTTNKVRRRIPHIYQDPEVSRYQDLNDLMMRKQEEKRRRICCFNISNNRSSIPDSIEIVIHSLTLAHNTAFMRNSDVTQLYIEYSFLGYDGEEMETMSAPLNSDLHMNFNYRRTFYVDYGMHFKQRTILSNILTSEDKNRRKLRFVVVSEPPEEQDHVKECEEIGYAEVDLVQLMTEGHDLIKENIPVRTANGTERIGFLTISMTGVKLMHKVAFETK